MIVDFHGNRATPGGLGRCGTCAAILVPKCGAVKVWHWAHEAGDCDPWSEPESDWHRAWKQFYAEHRGARVEVSMGEHRADVVTPNGLVVELQATYLDAASISEREQFYDNMIWLYSADRWADRLQFGRRGFWWKHAARSLTLHTKPVWWHLGDELLLVRLNVVEDVVSDTWPDGKGGVASYSYVENSRVLGRIVRRVSVPAEFAL